MTNKLRYLPLASLLVSLTQAALSASDTPKNCGCACCAGKEVCCCNESAPTKLAAGTGKNTDTAKRFPIRGVIVEVRPEQSSLLVKHEAIPGFMRAMTMLFKVDAPTLQAAKKGQTITATLAERDGDYWLEEVKPVPANPSS